MNLLLYAGHASALSPPRSITLDGATPNPAAIFNDAPAATVIFGASVVGLGQADGTWSLPSGSMAGPMISHLALSNTAGSRTNIVTVGTLAAAQNGTTTMSLVWTGQGGLPVLELPLALKVSTRAVALFNPSKLGWYSLIYGGYGQQSRLRTNAKGEMRPFDGASVYMTGSNKGANPYSDLLLPEQQWNGTQQWSTKINQAINSNGKTGLVLCVAVRWWSFTVPPTTAHPAHPGFPANKADFVDITNFTINTWWPVGAQTGDTAAQVRTKIRDMYTKFTQGWFDNVIFAPWRGSGTNTGVNRGLINRINDLNLPFVKVIVRPCWEGNGDWVPVGTSGASDIDTQDYGWIENQSDVNLMRAALKYYLDGLNGLSPGLINGRFELALNPLRDNHHPSTAFTDIIAKAVYETPNDGTNFISYIGPDVYDRNLTPAPARNANLSSTQQTARFSNNAGRTPGLTTFTDQLDIYYGSPGTGVKPRLCVGEWGPSTNIGTTETATSGNDDPGFIDGMWNIMSTAAAQDVNTGNAAIIPGYMGFEMLFRPDDTAGQYEMDVTVDSTNPNKPVFTYVGASNKPNASQRYHALYGLGYNSTVVTTTSKYVANPLPTTIGLTRTAANIIVPTGLNHNVENDFAVAAGKTLDLRDNVFNSGTLADPKSSRVRITSGGANAVVYGGKIQGVQPRSLAWFQMKFEPSTDLPGEPGYGTNLAVHDLDSNSFNDDCNANPLIFEHCVAVNGQDPFNMAGGTAVAVIMRSCYVGWGRDDGLENDGLHDIILIEDCLFNNVHSFISQDSNNQPTTKRVTLKNTLVRCGRKKYYSAGGFMAPGRTFDPPRTSNAYQAAYSDYYPTATVPFTPTTLTSTVMNWSGGGFFKGIQQAWHIDATDCVFCMDGLPASTGHTHWGMPDSTFSNCLFVWLGPTSGPGSYLSTGASFDPLPSGVTLSTDVKDWNREATAWISAHGGTATNDAWGFPICEDYPSTLR